MIKDTPVASLGVVDDKTYLVGMQIYSWEHPVSQALL